MAKPSQSFPIQIACGSKDAPVLRARLCKTTHMLPSLGACRSMLPSLGACFGACSEGSLTCSQACVQDAALVLRAAGAPLRARASFAAALYLYESGASFLSRCPTLGQALPLAQTRSLTVALWCAAVANGWLLVSCSRTLLPPWPTPTRLTSSGSAGTAGTMTRPGSILLPSGTGITRLAAPMTRSLSLSLSLSQVVLVVWRHVSQDIPHLSFRYKDLSPTFALLA